ncbi:hypothetical protein Pmi06nite_23210 [Planotetraspora mira]|uniref:Uncharacterized protein n=1 Tax=Planotetraspora mira TaxID=58121 RepID=A0A8J3X6J7_9ACTN|nr:hypothetical protein Pmi06nite_23210 [Planotetraspora mira]
MPARDYCRSVFDLAGMTGTPAPKFDWNSRSRGAARCVRAARVARSLPLRRSAALFRFCSGAEREIPETVGKFWNMKSQLRRGFGGRPQVRETLGSESGPHAGSTDASRALRRPVGRGPFLAESPMLARQSV